MKESKKPDLHAPRFRPEVHDLLKDGGFLKNLKKSNPSLKNLDNSTIKKVIEKFNEGLDKVESSVSYVLTDYVENLILSGEDEVSGTGNSLDNILIGNRAGNLLYGDWGNDTLDGGRRRFERETERGVTN